jgi:hypothetical protein
LLVWAGFWICFNVASALGERDGQWHHVTLAAMTAGLAVAAWLWPRLGGLLLIGGGALAALAFPNTAALAMLALPAAGIGILLLAIGAKRRAI